MIEKRLKKKEIPKLVKALDKLHSCENCEYFKAHYVLASNGSMIWSSNGHCTRSLNMVKDDKYCTLYCTKEKDEEELRLINKYVLLRKCDSKLNTIQKILTAIKNNKV